MDLDMAKQVIELFLEYRDIHGYNEEKAKEAALIELLDYETYKDENLTSQSSRPSNAFCSQLKGAIKRKKILII